MNSAQGTVNAGHQPGQGHGGLDITGYRAGAGARTASFHPQALYSLEPLREEVATRQQRGSAHQDRLPTGKVNCPKWLALNTKAQANAQIHLQVLPIVVTIKPLALLEKHHCALHPRHRPACLRPSLQQLAWILCTRCGDVNTYRCLSSSRPACFLYVQNPLSGRYDVGTGGCFPFRAEIAVEQGSDQHARGAEEEDGVSSTWDGNQVTQALGGIRRSRSAW